MTRPDPKKTHSVDGDEHAARRARTRDACGPGGRDVVTAILVRYLFLLMRPGIRDHAGGHAARMTDPSYQMTMTIGTHISNGVSRNRHSIGECAFSLAQ
ncbi:hypothetical protein, partial [Burkholderia multivorans]|uniref:hypothetical protein n=1 Tax=Burkholderia multivorans TaxID=87883 RepID=UPI00287020D0